MNNLKKNIYWNTIGTTLNSFSSLIYMVVIVRVNGNADAGIYTLAFSFACLFGYIGNYFGRVFQVSDTEKRFNDNEYIRHRIITCALMIVTTCLYGALMKYDMRRFMILLLTTLIKMVEMFSEVYFAILQKNDQLHIVGKSFTIKTILPLTGFIIFNLLTHNLVLSLFVSFVIGVLFIFVYDRVKVKQYVQTSKIRRGKIKSLFFLGFFPFLSLFLANYLINISKYMLDGNISDSLIAIYGIIQMPATIMSLVAVYASQPFTVQLTTYFKSGNTKQITKIVRNMLLFVLGCLVVILVGTYLIGVPVLNIVYNETLDPYKTQLLMFIAAGGVGGMCIIITSVLTIIKVVNKQFYIYLFVSILGTAISYIFVRNYGFDGAVWSYCIIMFIQFTLFMLLLIQSIKKLSKQKSL